MLSKEINVKKEDFENTQTLIIMTLMYRLGINWVEVGKDEFAEILRKLKSDSTNPELVVGFNANSGKFVASLS